MSYTELFTTQFLGSTHYAAVIFEQDTASFYHALFEYVCVRGGSGYCLKEKGKAIDLDTVGKLAYASEENRKEVIPLSGRPAETVKVIRKLNVEEKRECAAFSFEKTLIATDLVKGGDQFYIRVIDYDCCSGANGRPLYSLFEDYYEIKNGLIDFLTPENWRALARKTVAYHFVDRGTGVLF